MIIKCLPTGMFGSNCYILGENGEAAVIDAGVNADEVYAEAQRENLKIKFIILTHGHIDHICSADRLRDMTDAKLLIHQADAEALTNAEVNGSAYFGKSSAFRAADIVLKDADTLDVGGFEMKIIHTPGHTQGGICIKVDNHLFTGDTLFRLGIGRTDLPGGSYNRIISSIQDKLMTLDDEVVVYPGHGESTTIGHERKHNLFLKL